MNLSYSMSSCTLNSIMFFNRNFCASASFCFKCISSVELTSGVQLLIIQITPQMNYWCSISFWMQYLMLRDFSVYFFLLIFIHVFLTVVFYAMAPEAILSSDLFNGAAILPLTSGVFPSCYSSSYILTLAFASAKFFSVLCASVWYSTFLLFWWKKLLPFTQQLWFFLNRFYLTWCSQDMTLIMMNLISNLILNCPLKRKI